MVAVEDMGQEGAARPFIATLHGSAAEPTVVVDDVHVTYRVYEDRRPSLRRMVAHGFKPRSYKEIYAVRGVSLEARPGEAVGLIGRNGSGKSTLLRAVAGLMPPTKGAVYAHTEPTLLGVGAALNGQLSGRRNIYLGGLALGMTRDELEECVEEIIDFSGVRDAIDLPLRTYSSGMSARLHFSIASAVKPEVLLIDEALAVGDEDFKRRSQGRIQELLDGAGTVFLVSHSLGVVVETCSRVLWMEKGEVLMDGEPAAVVAAYQKSPERGSRATTP